MPHRSDTGAPSAGCARDRIENTGLFAQRRDRLPPPGRAVPALTQRAFPSPSIDESSDRDTHRRRDAAHAVQCTSPSRRRRTYVLDRPPQAAPMLDQHPLAPRAIDKPADSGARNRRRTGRSSERVADRTARRRNPLHPPTGAAPTLSKRHLRTGAALRRSNRQTHRERTAGHPTQTNVTQAHRARHAL